MATNDRNLFNDCVLPLDAVEVTAKLSQRPSKAKNSDAELAAMKRLAKKLIEPNAEVLQELADIILDVCGADSAGISIAEDDGPSKIFRWHAISGELRQFQKGTMPGDFSPCGIVVERKASVLVEKPIRYWPYIESLGMPLYEVLLTPFYRNGVAVGTIWAVAHNANKLFDLEDDRLLKSLAEMADLAVQANNRLQSLDKQKNALKTERDQAKSDKQNAEVQHAEFNKTIELERMSVERQTQVLASERDNLIRMFEAQPSPNVLWRGPDLIYERVSPSYQALFPRKVLIGKPFLEAVPEKEYVPFFSVIKSVFDTGVPVVMPEQLVPFDIDGNGMKDRYYTLSFFQVKNTDGTAYGVYQQATDNTEQVEAREVLRASAEALKDEQQKLETIFQESPAAMALWQGPDLIFEKVNPEYQLLFGDRPLVGKPLLEALPELADQEFPQLLLDVLTTGVPFVGKEVLAKIKRSENGEIEDRYFDFTYLRINDANGNPYGVYDHAIDVTERVVARLEIENSKVAAEAANQSKSAFLANMSHEIRTPLGAIRGFADLARQPDATPEQIASYLSVIDRNTVQVLRIIDDILDLAKVEAGRVELEIIPFSLTEFIADFSSLLGFKARENGIIFNINADTELPDQICTDPTRLRQILTNAVGNAIKFTSKGRVTLHIKFTDGVLQFGVEDTGRGISPQQMPNLFQAFAQADASTTRKFGGTGLGLILTKHLCQLMGGDYVLTRSEFGVGSRFDATIKVVLPNDAKIIPKAKVVFENVVDVVQPIKATDLDGVRVLLVEDSPDNQMLLQLILERQGVTLDIAADGIQGVSKALHQEYDIVLMDIQMPLMDGHEAVQRLRSVGYEKPIVALTAHAMKEEAERTKKSGFTDFLSKPVRREDLINIVARLIGRPG